MLTGHRKSGTSLLGKLFNGYTANKTIVYPTDLTVLYGGFDPFLSSTSREKFRSGLLKIVEQKMRPYDGMLLSKQQKPFSFERFYKALASDEVLSSSNLSRAELVDSVGRAFCRGVAVPDAENFIFKETSQLIYTRELLRPKARAVTIFRDPRDVFAAIKDGMGAYYARNGEDLLQSLQSVLFRYRVDYQAFRDISDTNQSTVTSIKFEDLVHDPESVLVGVCDFFRLPFDPDLLVPRDGDRDYEGNTFGTLSIPKGEITSRNVGRWRERLSVEDVEIIEFFLGDVLDGLGYERSVNPDIPSKAVSEHYRAVNSRLFFRNVGLEELFSFD